MSIRDWYDALKSGAADAENARVKRLVRWGWILAWIYFSNATFIIYGFFKRLSTSTDFVHLFFGSLYILFFALVIYGYVQKRHVFLIPLLVYKTLLFSLILILGRQDLESFLGIGAYDMIKEYYVALFWYFLVFEYVRACNKTIRAKADRPNESLS